MRAIAVAGLPALFLRLGLALGCDWMAAGAAGALLTVCALVLWERH